MLRDSCMTSCAGPIHLPCSVIFGASLLDQYVQSCPVCQFMMVPWDFLSTALRIACEFSVLTKASLAAWRRSKAFRNWPPWGLRSSARRCDGLVSSRVADAGNLGALPSTHCSGLYLWTLLRLFFALKHCWRHRSNSSTLMMGFSWFILYSISLTMPPCLSACPRCHALAVSRWLIPSSCKVAARVVLRTLRLRQNTNSEATQPKSSKSQRNIVGQFHCHEPYVFRGGILWLHQLHEGHKPLFADYSIRIHQCQLLHWIRWKTSMHLVPPFLAVGVQHMNCTGNLLHLPSVLVWPLVVEDVLTAFLQ